MMKYILLVVLLLAMIISADSLRGTNELESQTSVQNTMGTDRILVETTQDTSTSDKEDQENENDGTEDNENDDDDDDGDEDYED